MIDVRTAPASPDASFEVPSPNADFIRVWNDIVLPKFLAFRDVIIGTGSPHGDTALDDFDLRPGEHVLDVGSGFGDTTLQIARRVAPSGRAVGIDVCEPFAAAGREGAAAAGVEGAFFVVGDAQSRPFRPVYDAVFSRFGTMFFRSPVAALRNLRAALVPGGRFGMLTWAPERENPWLGDAARIAREILPPLPSDPDSCGPGPFSMANPELVTRQMNAAGFEGVRVTRVDRAVSIGATVEDAVRFSLALGPAGELLREAGAAGASALPRLERELASHFAAHLSPRGVELASSSWWVTAKNP